MNNAIISIGAGYEQLMLIRAIKRLGYAVIGVDRNVDALGFPLCDARIVRSTYEEGPIIRELEALRDRFYFRAVVTKTSGISSIVTAKIAEHLGLRGVPSRIAGIFADKSTFAEWARSAGLPVIPSEIVEAGKYPTLDLPLIVKPSLARGGKEGVRRVDDAGQFAEASRHALRFANDQKLMVQRYIEGIDVVVCNYLHDGTIVSTFLIDETNVWLHGVVVTTGFAVPSALSGALEREVMALNAAFITTSGLRDGIVWLSLRIPFRGTPYIMETHIDFAGDGLIDRLLPASNRNYDFLAEGVRVYAGERPRSIDRHDCMPSYIYFLYARDAAKSDELHSYDVELYPHVVTEADWDRKVGNIVLTGDQHAVRDSVDELHALLARPTEFTDR